MTEDERIAFIKDKLAPLFDGMNAEDVLEIIRNTYVLEQNVFSQFSLSLRQQMT